MIKLSYFYFAFAILVDHRLWLRGTKFKQLQFINVFNFKMSTLALTGWYFVLAKSGLYSVKTGLKGFELPIPRPSTVTKVVVELNKSSFIFAGNIKIDFCCDTFTWFLLSKAQKRYFCHWFLLVLRIVSFVFIISLQTLAIFYLEWYLRPQNTKI